MPPRQLLSPQARAALFDPPTDVRAIVRHYTFSNDDVTLIRQRRRNANRLGVNNGECRPILNVARMKELTEETLPDELFDRHFDTCRTALGAI